MPDRVCPGPAGTKGLRVAWLPCPEVGGASSSASPAAVPRPPSASKGPGLGAPSGMAVLSTRGLPLWCPPAAEKNKALGITEGGTHTQAAFQGVWWVELSTGWAACRCPLFSPAGRRPSGPLSRLRVREGSSWPAASATPLGRPQGHMQQGATVTLARGVGTGAGRAAGMARLASPAGPGLPSLVQEKAETKLVAFPTWIQPGKSGNVLDNLGDFQLKVGQEPVPLTG